MASEIVVRMEWMEEGVASLAQKEVVEGGAFQRWTGGVGGGDGQVWVSFALGSLQNEVFLT